MLKEVITTLTDLAKRSDISTILHSDVYQLNNLPDLSYSVLCIEQDEHTELEDVWRLRLRLTYVDLLPESNPEDYNFSLLDIQDTGLQKISNILNGIPEDWLIESRAYRVFNQRFNDDCAGVYCWITLDVPKHYRCFRNMMPK